MSRSTPTLHTDQSPDSSVPIDIYAAQAVERGIEIAITDHVDFDPRDPAFEYTRYEDRERTVRDAAERWAGRGVSSSGSARSSPSIGSGGGRQGSPGGIATTT